MLWNNRYNSAEINASLILSPKRQTHLQTLGGALTELSVVEVGGTTVVGQRPEWGSTNPGAVAAVLGKEGAARFGRWGVEAGDSAAGDSEGSDAKLVGLFRGATGAECLWSSLLILWNTSPKFGGEKKPTLQLEEIKSPINYPSSHLKW